MKEKEELLIRYASLVPAEGMGLELFFFCIDFDLEYLARQWIKEGKILAQQGSKVLPLSPLLFDGIKLTEAQIMPFITVLYMELDAAVAEFAKPCDTMEKEEEKLKRYREELGMIDLSPEERGFLKELDHQIQKDDQAALRHLYHATESLYNRRVSNRRKEGLRAFHRTKGNDILKVFHKICREEIIMTPHIIESLLNCMVEYYDMVVEVELESLNIRDMITAGEQLLDLLEKRNALSELWWVYLKLSEFYLLSFRENDDWEEKSNFYLLKSCEFAKEAYATYETQEG